MMKLRVLLAAMALCFSALAVPEIQFLNTYDQLSTVVGKTGHWFVRDAAGTSTGQHGDPTVLKGWAMYTWDTRKASGRAGWVKICEEESMDASAAESLIRNYVTKVEFNATIDEIKANYTLLSKHTSDITAIQTVLTSLDVRTSTVESDLAATKDDVTSINRRVTNLSNELILHEEWAKTMSNNVIRVAYDYTDAQVQDLREWSEAASNNVLTAAKAYTDEVAGKTDLRVYDSRTYFGTDNLRVNREATGSLLVDAVLLDYQEHRISVLKCGTANYFITELLKPEDSTEYANSRGFFCTGFYDAGFDKTSASPYPAIDRIVVLYDGASNKTQTFYGNEATEIARNLGIAKAYTDTEVAAAKAYATSQDLALSNKLDAVASQYALTAAAAAKEGAVTEANDHTDTKVALLKENLEATIVATNSATLTEAKSYADTTADAKDVVLSNRLDSVAKTYAMSAQTVAKNYTDSEAARLSSEMTAGDETTLNTATNHTNAEVVKLNAAIAAGDAATLNTATNHSDANLVAAKSYADNAAITAAAAAKEGAIATAAEDATTKANAAEARANTYSSTNLENQVTRIDTSIGGLDTRVAAVEKKISTVYHFKGSCTFAELPTEGNKEGDVWYVTDKKESYAWSAESNEWYSLGGGVDLSIFKSWEETKAYIDAADAVLAADIAANEVAISNKHALAIAHADEVAATAYANATNNAAARDAALKTEVNAYADAAASTAYVNATNEASAMADAARDSAIAHADGRLGNFTNNGREVTIGAGATNIGGKASINIDSYAAYPSSVSGDFNINLGIDNVVGDYEGTVTNGSVYHARYAVAIGTSARASKMHSYAWGSQINALEADSTVMGYGLTAYHPYSTVIGHGDRTIWDIKFTNAVEMTNYFKKAENIANVFVGYGILLNSGPGCTHIVDEVSEVPYADTGMYVKLRENPLDIETGYRFWRYGKSHGRGTVNLVALGNSSTDYGLANVYINDRSLSDWTGINIGQPTWKEVYNLGLPSTTTNYCAADYTVAIGNNAKALETASSCQSIAIGRDALVTGSAGVAVGPNSFSYTTMGIALGWRANAVGVQAISIGSANKSGQNYFVDGVVNTNSDLALAKGAQSIQIGFNGKALGDQSIALGKFATANAQGAVQIGTGTNTTANSLKFMGVDVVKDGKVCGTFDSKDLDPQELDISTASTTEELVITAMPHIVNTIASTNMCGPGTEIYVEPKGSRNYEIFVPNTAEFREGMPMSFDSEITDCKALFMSQKFASKLPIMLKVQQPCKQNVIFTMTELEDDMDWTPAITNCNIYFDVTAGKFLTQKVGSNSYSLQGTNLHAGVTFKLEYPISASATCTNDLMTLSAKDDYLGGTFYSYTTGVDFTPTQAVYFASDTSWFKVHYSTVNGDANTIQKTITIE